MKQTLLCALAILAGSVFVRAGCVVADDRSDAPEAASSLPHDRHGGLTITADAYSDADRAKAKFGKANPVPAGILPVEVTFGNETAEPMRVTLSTIQLNVRFPGGRQQYVDSLAVGQVADAIAHPNGPSAPSERRFPLGLPSGGDKKVDKLMDILRPLSLDADIVPPMGAIHGFLFFDVSHDFSVVSRSSLYIPDVATVPSNKPLIFFEIPLGAAEQ
jgi:hypothetical protein